MKRPRFVALVAAAGLFLAACEGQPPPTGQAGPSPAPSPPPMQAVKGWSQLVAGIDQRVPVGIVDPNGVPVPDATVRVQVITVPAPGSTASPEAVGPPESAPYK